MQMSSILVVKVRTKWKPIYATVYRRSILAMSFCFSDSDIADIRAEIQFLQTPPREWVS